MKTAVVNPTKTAEPIIKPKVHIDEEVKHDLLRDIQEEAQVIVHCTLVGTLICKHIRIWKSTYLVPHNSEHKSELMHAHNISLFPVWMPISPGKPANFTLVFSGLPKDCTEFDLLEIIPESGGFKCLGIKRNETDIYHIKL